MALQARGVVFNPTKYLFSPLYLRFNTTTVFHPPAPPLPMAPTLICAPFLAHNRYEAVISIVEDDSAAVEGVPRGVVFLYYLPQRNSW